MSLVLYSHPFSSYCQKVLIAFWENDIAFTYRHLEEPGVEDERGSLWPLGRFPVLTDNGKVIAESTIIIEYLDVNYPGSTRLVPEDRGGALEVRFMDRFFDNYVMAEVQKPVSEALKGEKGNKAEAIAAAAVALEKAYTWLEGKLSDRTWAAGEPFSLADCAAAPSLFYADWVHQIGAGFPTVRAYRNRLLARPSFARAVEEARQYRSYFPLGAPDRD